MYSNDVYNIEVLRYVKADSVQIISSGLAEAHGLRGLLRQRHLPEPRADTPLKSGARLFDSSTLAELGGLIIGRLPQVLEERHELIQLLLGRG